jgi:enoyl-CoA hydratase
MPVLLERNGACAVMTLDRPEALNALSFAVIEEIATHLDAVARSDARALLITGAGSKAFCAGADIKELRGRDLMARRRATRRGQDVFAMIERLPMPSVAVINGFAFGGGLELALSCTFRLATPNAKLGLPEIKLGLIPGYGGTQRLPRVIGEARALDMILTGRTVDAAEAERIGLVLRIVEGDPIAAGVAFAASFIGFGLPALSFAREAVRRGLTVPLGEGLKIEADLSTLAFQTADAEEGMSAFLEKRKPDFRDA